MSIANLMTLWLVLIVALSTMHLSGSHTALEVLGLK
jgi:hypothetical protein